MPTWGVFQATGIDESKGESQCALCCDTGDWTCPTCPQTPAPRPSTLILNSTEAALAVGFSTDSVHSRHSEMSVANRKMRISKATLVFPAWSQWVGYNNPSSPSRKFLLLSRDLQ